MWSCGIIELLLTQRLRERTPTVHELFIVQNDVSTFQPGVTVNIEPCMIGLAIIARDELIALYRAPCS